MSESDGQVIERLTRDNMLLAARVAALEAALSQLSKFGDPAQLAAEMAARGRRIADLERLLDDASDKITELKLELRGG